jgi:hypothetical protein
MAGLSRRPGGSPGEAVRDGSLLVTTTDVLARIDGCTARVVVVGQGYVGLPSAMRAAESGLAVTGFEIDLEGAAGARRAGANSRARSSELSTRRRSRFEIHARGGLGGETAPGRVTTP